MKSPSSAAPEAADQARLDIPENKPEAAAPAPVQLAPRPAPAAVPAKPKAESLIAPDITIEGKIEGAGHVRIAGSFKGDISVRGDLTIEPGAKVTGSVRAEKVTIAGELTGNIESAVHVELLQSGALTGDLKAGSLSVAAGSRMRGQVEFGWDDNGARTSNGHGGTIS
ncbi:polymer-forming cytoskeletal protein [Rhodanobacter sp. Si-c]|uniref:Polymer-forming cytoskeletal protein n=1 Tax=Rhodanobacter lycopersici TaxID=3162487 RepID=A0ABV3QGI1_9GAMM